MTPRLAGLWLITGGVVAIALGLLVWSGALSWFGRLPGDIRIDRESARFYFPITSLLIASALLSALLSLIRRLLR